MRRKLAAMIFAAMLPAAAPAAAVTIDSIAAIVNGEVITLLELEEAGKPLIQRELAQLEGRERDRRRREILQGVLDQLVEKQLQRQRARELGISVSRQEIDEAIAAVREKNRVDEEMFQRLLRDQGISVEAYRKEIGEQVLFSKVIRQEIRTKITVGDDEIAAYYREHREEYAHPERIRIRHLLIEAGEADAGAREDARRTAETILEKYRAGTDFSALVRTYSPATVAGDENVSGFFARGEFLPELEDVAFSLAVGEVGGPVESPAGIHLIQVVEREEASQAALDDVRDNIEKILGEEKGREMFGDWLRRLREEARIKILF